MYVRAWISPTHPRLRKGVTFSHQKITFRYRNSVILREARVRKQVATSSWNVRHHTEGETMNALRRHAADPDVLTRTTGLVNFLQEMVRSSHQRQRDDRSRGKDRLWLSDLPAQIRKPGVREDGVLLQLKHVPQEPPPDLPELLEGWIDPLACLDPDAEDPPLADEGPAHSRLPVPAGTLRDDEVGRYSPG